MTYFIIELLITVFVYGPFLIFPIYLTKKNVASFIKDQLSDDQKVLDLVGLALGFALTYGYMSGTVTSSDWPEVLVNEQLHSPIYSKSVLTVVVLLALSILSYLLLTYVPLAQFSPLVLVFSLAGLYLGMGLSILWMVQALPLLEDFSLLYLLEYLLMVLLAFNYLIICLKTLRISVRDWQEAYMERKNYRWSWLTKLQVFVGKQYGLHLLGFLALFPLLGFAIACLTLFGQEPDALIKAWTETSDWQLSERVSPPNVFYDEHYLCTVGASGHRWLVKPLRMGIRHGHRVVVNRQLCVANAFEQIIEERLPSLHRPIRRVYDRYGYPIARHIKQAWQADLIYLLMKPLEWFFLLVIYLCDTQPENRIARQYLPVTQ